MSGAAWAIGFVSVACLLVATALGPLWLMLAAPLLLGVPHVAADVWMLVVRAPHRVPLGIGLALAGIVAGRAAGLLGAPPPLAVEHALGCAAIAVGFITFGARPLAWAALVALVGVLLWWPGPSLLALAHLHNAVALVWLAVLARESGRLALAAAVGAPAMLGAAIVLAGGLDGVFTSLGSAKPPVDGFGLDALTRQLAPGLPEPIAARLVLLFAYGQAVHYLSWLAFAPIAARVPARAVGVGAALALALLPGLALWDAPTVRGAYLSLVAFHAWMELALLYPRITAGRA